MYYCSHFVDVMEIHLVFLELNPSHSKDALLQNNFNIQSLLFLKIKGQNANDKQ